MKTLTRLSDPILSERPLSFGISHSTIYGSLIFVSSVFKDTCIHVYIYTNLLTENYPSHISCTYPLFSIHARYQVPPKLSTVLVGRLNEGLETVCRDSLH